MAVEVPFVTGAGPLGGAFRQDSGEWGLFVGLHGGALGAHAGLGWGVTMPPKVNAFLNKMIGKSPRDGP